MFSIIKKDIKLQLLLLLGLVLQIYFSLVQVGFFHPDQHFQIIEFSSYQLHQPNFATSIWEFDAQIRPTIQVYLFSGCRFLFECIGIKNPYNIITIVQTITGLAMFWLFNAMAFFYLKNYRKKILFYVLLMLNFSFCFPFVKTLYSSETLGALLFFGALFYYNKKEKHTPTTLVFTSFLMGLSFYARFQIAFALIGFGIYILLFAKQYKQIGWLIIGFVVAIILNVYLDYLFYHKWVFTPFNYYQKNIVEGVANGFGTSSFINYIIILACVVVAPFLSIILFGVSIKSLFKNFKHPLVITSFFFVLGHCFVGHKEERFLFPVFCALPIIIGFQLEGFLNFINKINLFFKYILKFIIGCSLAFNIFLITVFCITPYSQTVHFSKLVTNKFSNNTINIYYKDRNCFQTESHLKLEFYKQASPNINLINISNLDTLNTMSNAYFISTYNDIGNNKTKLDSLNFKPQLSSSNLLWTINEKLHKKNINTINDIWMLYHKN